jgi:hypothetical protein
VSRAHRVPSEVDRRLDRQERALAALDVLTAAIIQVVGPKKIQAAQSKIIARLKAVDPSSAKVDPR